MAAETVIESFCERCGTRYTFEPVRKRESRLVGLGKQLGILLEDHAATQAQRDPFHGTFHFCLDCRQYTCPRCWNEAAGFCLGCMPLPDGPDLVALAEAEAEAGLEAATWMDQAAVEHAALADPRAWPDADLHRGHVAVPEPAGAAAILGAEAMLPEPVTEPDPAPLEDPEDSWSLTFEPEPEPQPDLDVPQADLHALETDLDLGRLAAVTGLAIRPDLFDDDVVRSSGSSREADAAVDPADIIALGAGTLMVEAEAEAVAEAEAEPELVVEADAELQPEAELVAEAEVEVEAEPELVVEADAELQVEAEPELVAEADAELQAAAELVAEVEPQPEAEPVAEAEVEAEAEPVAEAEAEVGPEAELQVELVAEAEPELVAKAEVEAEPEVEPELVAESEPEVEVGPEAEFQVELVAASEPEQLVEAEPELVAESEPELVAEVEREPEVVAAPAVELIAPAGAAMAPDDDAEADWADLFRRLPDRLEDEPTADEWSTLAPWLGPDIAPSAPVPSPAAAPAALPAPAPAPTPVAPPPAQAWQITAPSNEPDARPAQWPPLGPVFRPQPAVPQPAPHPSMLARHPSQGGLLARGHAASGGGKPVSNGVRPCINCELPLSANARFCRRCGRPQG